MPLLSLDLFLQLVLTFIILFCPRDSNTTFNGFCLSIIFTGQVLSMFSELLEA